MGYITTNVLFSFGIFLGRNPFNPFIYKDFIAFRFFYYFYPEFSTAYSQISHGIKSFSHHLYIICFMIFN